MDTVTIGVTQAGMTTPIYRVHERATAGTAPPITARQIYVLPAWLRHGTQPNYWTETWLRKERLADWDRVAGTVYEADNIEDVIRQLDEAADAPQAD